eukprot:TRINITY_DN2194_c0_g1_i6.p1 TRINITY_DN2194_c0_g1~~TRINITY_DN2194_c0_g1_i6.p1  ORF type:complete len:428 (+),score=92.43 TRINITY_DN2194_c0_g1_i6:66-1349(+)
MSQMPKDVEARIRALPGNNTCVDCNNNAPQWASVSYGSLMCLECSGQHRSLGVHLSFVRSIQMDSWTERQIAAMEKSGGNQKLVEFFQARGIEKSLRIATKYNTKQAAYYRERLTRWLDGKTEPPPDPGRFDPTTGVSEAQGAEPLPGETTDQYNARQARLREEARERLRAKFGNSGSMGSVGSHPLPDESTGLGGLASGAVGTVGGLLGGAANFVRTNVIENENLREKLGDTASTVGSTVGGLLGRLSQSAQDGELVNSLRRNVTLQEGSAVSQGFGWASQTASGLMNKAGQGLGEVSSGVGNLFEDGQGRGGYSQAPRSMGGKKGATDFDDDDWGDVVVPPPKEVTKADVDKLAKEMGMKLNAGPEPLNRAKSAPAAAAATSPPATSPEKASPAPSASPLGSPAKPKAKSKALSDPDDFFSEFGM